MTLSGGWVNCCDANFVTFFYRFFRRSITHNNISLRAKKVILDTLPQHSTVQEEVVQQNTVEVPESKVDIPLNDIQDGVP